MAAPRSTRPLQDGVPTKGRVLVVEARFYDDIADQLLEGAKGVLEAEETEHVVVTVPGALEIPGTIAICVDAAAASGHPFDAVVALGCVIRGETSHYEIVAGESARAIMDLTITRGLPIGNGILTVEDDQQAFERANVSEMNKGGGAAEAALAVLRIKRRAAAGRL